MMRRFLLVAVLAFFLPSEVVAQGKGGAKNESKKRVTPSTAVATTRELLIKHGYQVVRIEMVDAAQVVYYRRGNMGKGKGLGPIERMVVRPRGDIVVFDGGPSVVIVDVKLRLGL
jgi:hypothetical protein